MKLLGLIKDKINNRIGYYFYSLMERLRFDISYNCMMDSALHCTEQGVSLEHYCDCDVIVSLTTYGERLFDVASTIESIMRGSMKPNRIVLCLAEELRGTVLPITLEKQKERGLEVLFCKDVGSYKKLLPTMRKYPDAVIITIDDDAIYHFDMVERLVNEHIKFPKDVIANRVRRIELDDDKKPIGYLKWPFLSSPSDDSSLDFATGVGGILYPPHCFTEEVFNETVFMDICRYADDVWFYAMELLAGMKVRKCITRNAMCGGDYQENKNVQDGSLYQKNRQMTGSKCLNDMQLQAVLTRYNLYDKLGTVVKRLNFPNKLIDNMI